MSPLLLAFALVALLVLLQSGLWWLARTFGRRLGWPTILAGFLIPLALVAPWFAPDRVLAPTSTLHIPGAPEMQDGGPHGVLNDAVLQLIPWEIDVRHALAAGRLPLWSDLVDGGSSPWVNPQAGVLSPLAMLTRPLPIQYFLLAALVFKMMVALQGATLLARACGARPRWALIAGVAFALGGGIQAWGVFPLSRAAAWIPWVTLGAVTTMRRTGWRPVVGTAVALAAMLLEGHPEAALAGGLFAAVTALSLAPRRRLSRAGRWPAGVLRAALAAMLGLALATPHVLPFLSALPDSSRAAETLEDLDRTTEMKWQEPNTWFYDLRGKLLLAPLARDVFGFPYSIEQTRGAISWPDSLSGYAGIVALAAAFAALAGRRRRIALPFLSLALVSFTLASEPLLLMRLLFEWPPLRAPAYARALLVASLAVSVAGALGLQTLASGLSRRAPAGGRRGVGAFVAMAMAAGLALLAAPSGFNALLWVIALGLAFALVHLRPSRQPLMASAFLALALVDLLPWARACLPVGPPAIFYPPTAAITRVVSEVAVDGPWRVAGEDFLFYPNLPTVYGLADPRAHNPMAPAAQIAALGAAFDFAPTRLRYFAPLHHPEHPLLDFLGVRVVISSRYRPPLDGFERLSDEFDPFVLWRNPDALPRWFLASGADEPAQEDVGGWIRNMTDPRRIALVPGTLSRLGCAELEAATGTVQATQTRPGRVELALPPATPPCSVLATSIPFAKGWHARGDGAARATLAVDGGYLGVAPAGATRIELRYTPPGFWLGWVLCLAAVGVLVRLYLPLARQPPAVQPVL